MKLSRISCQKISNFVTNRFSADIWRNNFRIDLSSTSESNSFPFQAFEFSSTWGLSRDQFLFLESKKKIQKSIEIFLIHSQERLWYKICGMIRPCHCSFPQNTSTLGVRLALGAALRLLLLILSAFLGLVYPSSRFKRSFSVWFVFSFKISLFFEANYRFDKHSGFHVCLAKNLFNNLCWLTQVWFKRLAAQKTEFWLVQFGFWPYQGFIVA